VFCVLGEIGQSAAGFGFDAQLCWVVGYTLEAKWLDHCLYHAGCLVHVQGLILLYLFRDGALSDVSVIQGSDAGDRRHFEPRENRSLALCSLEYDPEAHKETRWID
jgi:hypothetical protein